MLSFAVRIWRSGFRVCYGFGSSSIQIGVEVWVWRGHTTCMHTHTHAYIHNTYIRRGSGGKEDRTLIYRGAMAGKGMDLLRLRNL